MSDLEDIHTLLTMLETRIEKLEKSFEGRLLHLDRKIQANLRNELVKLDLSLVTQIKMVLLKIKQLFMKKPPV